MATITHEYYGFDTCASNTTDVTVSGADLTVGFNPDNFSGYPSYVAPTDLEFQGVVETMIAKYKLEQEENKMYMRKVSIYVIDTDENVELPDRILYEEENSWTDDTDDEIKLGLNIKELLKSHNARRVEWCDEKEKPLKRIKLRDLKIIIKEWVRV